MGHLGDFGLAVLILEGFKRPGSSEKEVYIGNTGHIKKSSKFQNSILVPGVRKNDFNDFSGIFTGKIPGFGNLE